MRTAGPGKQYHRTVKAETLAGPVPVDCCRVEKLDWTTMRDERPAEAGLEPRGSDRDCRSRRGRFGEHAQING